MKLITIVGLFLMLAGCTSSQHSSHDELRVENSYNQNLASNSGLQIDYGINRGTGYTDSLGTKFNLRYIPVTITNDSTISIRFELEFVKEYDYTGQRGDQKFQVFTLPGRWALDGSEISDRMIIQLPMYAGKPNFGVTLEPNDKVVFAIGTLYNAINYGPVPNALFFLSDIEDYLECDRLTHRDKSTNPHLSLALKIDFYHWTQPKEGCTIIPCGQISYPE